MDWEQEWNEKRKKENENEKRMRKREPLKTSPLVPFMVKEQKRSQGHGRLAGSARGRATLDLEFVRSSPTLGGEIT